MVLALCETNPVNRLKVTEVSNFLEKHQESIENKVNFVVDNAPQKLHMEIMNIR